MRCFMCVSLLFLLTACNTVEGVGRDIRSAGDAISGSAQNTRENMRR